MDSVVIFSIPLRIQDGSRTEIVISAHYSVLMPESLCCGRLVLAFFSINMEKNTLNFSSKYFISPM